MVTMLRVWHPVVPGRASTSSTALTLRCCLWWPSRFSPFREVRGDAGQQSWLFSPQGDGVLANITGVVGVLIFIFFNCLVLFDVTSVDSHHLVSCILLLLLFYDTNRL